MGKLTNWKDHTVHALEETCRGLQLESGGSRPDLVARLIDYELEKMQLDFQRFCISPDADPQGKKKLLKEAFAIRENFELGARFKKAAFYEYADSIEQDALQNSSQKYKENVAFIEKMLHKQEFVIRLKQQREESRNSADVSFEEAKLEGTEMKKGGIGIEAAREGIVCKEVVGKQSAEKQAIEKGLFKKDQDKVVRFEKSPDALTNPSAAHLGGEKGGNQSRKVGRSTEIRRVKSHRNVSGGVKVSLQIPSKSYFLIVLTRQGNPELEAPHRRSGAVSR
jgi:hypothetical protein